MSTTQKKEWVRVSDAVARTTGRRWCSACQMDKPVEGFVKQGCRWRCAACMARSRAMNGGRK